MTTTVSSSPPIVQRSGLGNASATVVWLSLPPKFAAKSLERATGDRIYWVGPPNPFPGLTSGLRQLPFKTIDWLSREVAAILSYSESLERLAAIGADDSPLVAMMIESGTPLTPIRLKCALLGLGVLKVALHKAAGTPLPEEWAGIDEVDFQ